MSGVNESLQQAVCQRVGTAYVPSHSGDTAGIALESLAGSPIYGVRHSAEDGFSGWFIWAGEYSEAEDFYRPVCVAHLDEMLPTVIPYLGLGPGYRFIIDRGGYEDVWFEGGP